MYVVRQEIGRRAAAGEGRRPGGVHSGPSDPQGHHDDQSHTPRAGATGRRALNMSARVRMRGRDPPRPRPPGGRGAGGRAVRVSVVWQSRPPPGERTPGRDERIAEICHLFYIPP